MDYLDELLKMLESGGVNGGFPGQYGNQQARLAGNSPMGMSNLQQLAPGMEEYGPALPPAMGGAQPGAMPSMAHPQEPESSVAEPYNFLERFLAAYGGNPGAIDKDKERYKTEKQAEKIARLANDPDVGKDPSKLLLKIAQTTGDPKYLVALADLQKKQSNPLTGPAKLKADLDAGLIDKNTYDRALAKEIAPTEKNYKQFQLQNAGFADRMVNAAMMIDKTASKEGFTPVNEESSVLSEVPLAGGYLSRIAQSPEQQSYNNAAQEWIRAKLRKESGAAIGVKEAEDEYKTYFPMPGDGPAVIKQKAKLREVATDSMIKQTSGAYDDMYGDPRMPTQPPAGGKSGGKGNRIKFDELP